MSEAIRVIVFKDNDQWIGQCLEYDIAAQAGDLDTLRSRLLMTLEADFEASIEFNGSPFAGIEPAPPFFHDMWTRCATKFRDVRSIKGNGKPVSVELALAA